MAEFPGFAEQRSSWRWSRAGSCGRIARRTSAGGAGRSSNAAACDTLQAPLLCVLRGLRVDGLSLYSVSPWFSSSRPSRIVVTFVVPSVHAAAIV
jgi:hypothetical protein